MTHRGPFQPLLLFDSVISLPWSSYAFPQTTNALVPPAAIAVKEAIRKLRYNYSQDIL